jgi:retron-type reverse transcriptase
VDRCQQHARRYRYVLKADIRKFFPSIDHAILKGLVARTIKDAQVRWLIGLIIDHSNPQEPVQEWFAGDDLFSPAERRRGLPLGNQTSQFLANVYLDPLDHFVQDRLGLGAYVRYVDDLLVFADDKRRLAEARRQVSAFLAGLRLRLHPDKSVVFPVRQGIRFLGYRVFPSHRLLVPENVRRFRRRLRDLQGQYARYEITLAAARTRILSWIGHARQAGTYCLRRRLFAEHPFRRAAAVKPRAAWRLVSQPIEERPRRQS